ncbi:MAG: ATP-dependent helicase [Candidatus Bipolaricaulaceae bacterium]
MADILNGLNPAQLEAVTHGQGPLLVLAGVGTGKTTVIARRIAHLIDEGLVQRPSQLLVFTFSHQAAEEMLDRAFDWVGYAALDAWVATYHAVCERILRENAPLAGLPPDFRILDEWDQRVFLLDHLWELPLRTLKPGALRHPLRFLNPVLSFIHQAKDEAVSPTDHRRWAEAAPASGVPPDEVEVHRELAEVYATYQQLLAQEGMVDFGDLILRTVRLLEMRPGLLADYQRRFPHVLADEFQDTSRAQLRLVQLLAGHRNITVVGDDDQAIYGFRGVPWDNLLAFLREFPEAKVVVLEENFRSTQGILGPAVRLIRQNRYRLESLSQRGEIPQRITKELRAAAGEGPGPVHRHFPTVLEEAEFLAGEVKRLAAQGVPYREMAVLYRNRYRPDPYLKALSEAEVPWVLAGRFGAGLFDQEEIKLVLAALRAIADPRDDQALYHLLGSPIYRMPGEDLARLTSQGQGGQRPLRSVLAEAVEQGSLSPDGLRAGRRLLAHLAACQGLAGGNPTGRVLYAFLMEQTGYLEQLAHSADPPAGRALEHIAGFFEHVVHRFEQVARHDRVPWFVRYVEELRALGWSPLVGEAEPGTDAVQVMTFHQAKGLEFAAVFLTGLVEDYFPGRPRRPTFVLPEQLRDASLPGDVAHLEEQRRLFYVGMTRAKQHLFLLSAADYRAPGEEPRRRPAKVSRFVLEALGPAGVSEEAPEPPPLHRIARAGRQPAAPAAAAREGGPLTLSYQQVDDYLTCPLKYRYVHHLRVPIRLHPTVIYGHAVHRAVQAYHMATAQGRTLPLAQVVAVFRNAWRSEGFLAPEQEEAMIAQGEQALQAFCAFEQEQGGRPTFVEKYFAFAEGGARVVGYWDRVDRTGRGAVIIDYKTTEVTPSSAGRRARESLQLAIYALAYARLFGERPRQVQLRFLTPEVVVGRSRPTDRMLERAVEAVRETEAGIRAQEFSPKPSLWACRPCAYRTICPVAKPL